MKKVILDTNFILSCVRQKIDFFEDILFMGMKILIPIQVIDEIKKISESKKKLHFREDANLALKILEQNKFEKIKLEGKYVDDAIIEFGKKNENLIVASLDREIKKKVKNMVLVIRGRKNLKLV